MKFKDKWLACISLGEQTFKTHLSDQLSNRLKFAGSFLLVSFYH